MSKKEKIIRFLLLTLGILNIIGGIVFIGFNIAIGAIISFAIGVILLLLCFLPYPKRK